MNKLTRELNNKDILKVMQNGAERDLEYGTLKTNVINSIPEPTPTYLVYTAIVTQSFTAAPVVTVLENTIGNIIWTYTGVGLYDGTLVGAFPSASTVGFVTTESGTGTSYRFSLGVQTADVFRISSFDAAGIAANDWQAFIEIRVY